MATVQVRFCRRHFIALQIASMTGLCRAGSGFSMQPDQSSAMSAPSSDIVFRHLPESFEWIPLIDDPSNRLRRELWRLFSQGRFNRTIGVDYWCLASTLASGGTDFVLSVLNDEQSRGDFLRVIESPKREGVTEWCQLSVALGMVGRAGVNDVQVFETFAKMTSRIADDPYVRIVNQHLSKRQCDSLLTLGVPKEFASLTWKRVLVLLYVLGPCEWLTDRALEEIVRATEAERDDALCPEVGPFVLAQVGVRGHAFLERLDARVVVEADMPIYDRRFEFILFHAMASVASGRSSGPDLVRRSFTLLKANKGPSGWALVDSGLQSRGIMNRALGEQLAKAILEAATLWQGMGPNMVLASCGRYTEGAVGPLLGFLRKDASDADIRRLVAASIAVVCRAKNAPAIRAQLKAEKDECVKKILEQALEFLLTLEDRLLFVVDVDGVEFNDGTECKWKRPIRAVKKKLSDETASENEFD